MSASNNKIKRHPAWMDKLFPVVFTIAGLALLIIGSQTLFDGFSSKSWETTEGVIVESRLLDKGSGSGKKSNRRNYEPLVVYSYTIDGEYLTSDRILFGMSSYGTFLKSGEIRSREWIRRYPKGAKVSVSYDSKDPRKSSLNTGAHFTAWVAPAMGIVFLFLGLLLFRSSKKHIN